MAPRVLIVEDEGLVALLIEDLLTDLGCEVVASCDSIRSAMEWLERGSAPDGALLDVNLGGELVYPVAEFLAARKIPFADVPVLAKPVNQAKLKDVVERFGAAA